MNNKRATMILNYLFGDKSNKKYFINIKFIIQKEPKTEYGSDGGWIIRDKRDPVLHNGKIAILSKNSKPGMLIGIDKIYYERSYPVVAVVYGIYLLNKPNIDKLKPMRMSPPNVIWTEGSESYLVSGTNCCRTYNRTF
jgi:hypothetical protein